MISCAVKPQTSIQSHSILFILSESVNICKNLSLEMGHGALVSKLSLQAICIAHPSSQEMKRSSVA